MAKSKRKDKIQSLDLPYLALFQLHWDRYWPLDPAQVASRKMSKETTRPRALSSEANGSTGRGFILYKLPQRIFDKLVEIQEPPTGLSLGLIRARGIQGGETLWN